MTLLEDLQFCKTPLHHTLVPLWKFCLTLTMTTWALHKHIFHLSLFPPIKAFSSICILVRVKRCNTYNTVHTFLI